MYLVNEEQWLSYGRDKLFFRGESPTGLARAYVNKILIDQKDPEASVLTLTMNGVNPAKDMDFLNNYIQAFIEYNLAEKNQVAENTIRFIDQQLIAFNDSLGLSESKIEDFNVSRSTISISEDATYIYEEIKRIQVELTTLEIELNYYEYLEKYLRDESETTRPLVPATVGISDPIAAAFLQRLVELQTELRTNEILKDQNAVAKKKYESQFLEFTRIKEQIQENIRNVQQRNQNKKNILNRELGDLTSEIRQIPGAEAVFQGIQREFRLNENIYVMLLSRKTDLEIQRA